MSREKQIEEMARVMDNTCVNCCDCNCIEKANRCTAESLYEAGFRKQEWISVDEMLPGVSGRYICAVKDKNGHTWTVAGDYNLEMKAWFGLLFGEIKNTVTHWMPLPEPPKGE